MNIGLKAGFVGAALVLSACGWIPGMGKTEDADFAQYQASRLLSDGLSDGLSSSDPTSYARITASELPEQFSKLFQSEHGTGYSGAYWGPNQHVEGGPYSGAWVNLLANFKLYRTGNNSVNPFLYKALDDYAVSTCRGISGYDGTISRPFRDVLFTMGSLTEAERNLPDEAIRLAIAGTRSLWRSKAYGADHPSVQALAYLYRTSLAIGGDLAESKSRQALCVALLLAPQFLLGAPDGTAPLARLALKIGRRSPTDREISDYLASPNRSQYLVELFRRLKEEDGVFGIQPNFVAENAGVIAQLGGTPENADFYLRSTHYRDFLNDFFADWLDLRRPPYQASTRISADNDFMTQSSRYIIGSPHLAGMNSLFPIPHGPSMTSTDVHNTLGTLAIPAGIRMRSGAIDPNPVALELGVAGDNGFSNKRGPNDHSFDQIEPCDEEAQPYEQEFDAETTALAVEEQRTDGSWDFVAAYCDDGSTTGNCAVNLGLRGRLLSTFVASRVKPLAEFGESQIAVNWIPSLGAWQTRHAIAGAPHLPFTNRRVIRYGRDYTPMTGFSRVRHYPTGARIYVCNTTSRFAVSCAYRPPTIPTNPVTNQKIGVVSAYRWFAPLSGNMLPNAYGVVNTAPAGRGYMGMSQDSILHPNIFAGMRCGNVNMAALRAAVTPAQVEAAYPRGTLGNYNDWIFYNRYNDENSYHLSPEFGILGTERGRMAFGMQYMAYSLTEETYNLLWYMVRNQRSMKEMLTGNYRIMNGPHLLSVMNRRLTLPGFLPGSPHPDDPGFNALRLVEEKELQPISANFFKNSVGGTAPDRRSEILPGVTAQDFYVPQEGLTGRDFGGMPVSGVLTQPNFVGQYNSIRQLSAAILEKFTCRTVEQIPATNHALAQKFIFDDASTGSKHSHLDKQCYGCHRVLDPVAAAISDQFMVNGAAGGEMQYPFGKSGDRARASPGAILSTPVTGIKQTAQVLANSPEFSACMVKKVFVALHGREASSRDAPALGRLTRGFRQHYRFEKLLEEVLADPSYIDASSAEDKTR